MSEDKEDNVVYIKPEYKDDYRDARQIRKDELMQGVIDYANKLSW